MVWLVLTVDVGGLLPIRKYYKSSLPFRVAARVSLTPSRPAMWSSRFVSFDGSESLQVLNKFPVKMLECSAVGTATNQKSRLVSSLSISAVHF